MADNSEYPGVGWLLVTIVPALPAWFFSYGGNPEHESEPNYVWTSVSLVFAAVSATCFLLGIRGVLAGRQRGRRMIDYMVPLCVGGIGLALAATAVLILREGGVL